MHPNYAAPPVKKSRSKAVILSVVAAVLLLCVGGALIAGLSGGSEHPGIDAAQRAAVAGQVTQAATPADTTSDEPAAAELTAKDVVLQAKIVRQACFGSAGCSTEIDVKAGWPDGFAGTYEVAYTMAVPGTDDVSDTVTLYAESGKYDRPSTAYTSPQHKVTAKAIKFHIDSIERLS
jgi:hypothetical protein